MGLEQARRAHQRTHGGNPWVVMRQRGWSREQILDFSVDVNPLGVPDMLRAAILEHLKDIQWYPDPDAHAFRGAVAGSLGVPVNTVLPGNGSAELITLVATCRPVAKAVVFTPTFTEYEWALEQRGAAVECIPLEEADACALQGADLVFLCNPNNPTGTVMAKPRVLALAQRCREAGALLIVDEAFIDFLDDSHTVTVAAEAAQFDHVVVLRSLTKAFAIPGLRLGYLIAAPDLAAGLRALQPAWPLNTLALGAGTRLLQETAYLAASRRAIAEWRGELSQQLRAMGPLRPFPSAANFILCELTTAALSSTDLCERLASRGILIRNCDSFTGLEPGRFIRVAVRTPEENRRLIAALREVLTHAG